MKKFKGLFSAFKNCLFGSKYQPLFAKVDGEINILKGPNNG